MVSSPKKNIASRYLENLESSSSSINNGPILQPSMKLNTPNTTPRKLKISTFESQQQLSPIKTNLEKSIAELKLDSPSPLKRSLNSLSLKSKTLSSVKNGSSNSKQQSGKGYEYLCRVSEAKKWLEFIIGEPIPNEIQLLTDGLRNGVILAKLAKALKPELVKRIIPDGSGLHFKHTENINVFFQLLDELRMPDLFRFELTDLYDKKNIPKVVFCIHALSFMVSQSSPNIPPVSISNERFTDEDIKKSQQSLQGVSFPNFDSMNKQFGRELSKQISLDYSPPKSSKLLDNRTILQPDESSSVFLVDPSLQSSSKLENFKLKEPPSKLILDDIKTFQSDSHHDYNASPTKTRKLSESEYLKTIIKFQSISRGAIFRYNMFVDRIMLKSMAENIIQLQSLARRSLVLTKLNFKSSTFTELEPDFVHFQSIIRGNFQRESINVLDNLQQKDNLIQLQSIVRGKLVRDSIDKINFELFKYEKKLLRIQSKIRSNKIYSRTEKSLQIKENLIKFQAHSRRVLFQKKLAKSVNAAHSSEDAIKILQSIIRGNSTRIKSKENVENLKINKSSLIELQSIIRGGISRNGINQVLDILDEEELNLQKLVAVARGKLVRKETQRIQNGLQLSTYNVVKVQSIIRGVLSRYAYDCFLDGLEYYTEETVGLQASIRGYLYRQSKKEVMKYYEQHLPSIIKIQSFIRGKYLGNAYKSLISMENPPLSVIKKFAYLLNDSDVDFEEEVTLTRLKESINNKSKDNELLEKHINQLDLKIALLQKNKITLDELLVQKNKSIKPSNGKNSIIDVTSFNRNAKTRMELYEKLFYLLQTQPAYLTRLINRDYRGTDIALKIFNNLQSTELPTREEYLFIRLVESLLKDSIMKSSSIDELQKRNNLGWQTLIKAFNIETQKLYYQRNFNNFIESLIETNNLDFESDPVLIYQKIHSTSIKLPVDKAIDDPDTKQAFIANLQQMREFGTELFNIINENIEKLPIHIKILSKIAYQTSLKKFPQNLEQDHLSNSGFVLINGFINIILENHLDIFQLRQSQKVSNGIKYHFKELSKLMVQLFSMKPFGQENIYLQPLNKFINSSVDSIRSLIKSTIEIGEIDTVYNMTIYDDITAHNRPNLTLRISDMLSIDKLIQNEIKLIAPLKDDILREIILAIQSNKASDISKINGYFTLNLNPSSYKIILEDTRIKSLKMQAKRCILYLIQVQNEYDNLFDLLKSSIETIHELKFKQIINHENIEIKSMRVNDYINNGQGFLGDLTKISYHKLKEIALERILELESIGLINRLDSFQIILNEITYDIKTKHDQRLSRKNQLKIAQNTLIRLDEKFKFLTQQLNSYNLHIDKSMEELQLKPLNHKKRILPFTKQFFYERELKKTGKLPKFGAYKISCKKLYEKGILIELKGLNKDLSSSSSSSSSSNFFGGIINFPKIDFMFNCNKSGIFEISLKSQSLPISGNLQILTIDQLLEYQFENKSFIILLNETVKFDTNCLINFIFKKFYHYNES
ncbi:hypothetical protein WICMUC_005564 [Wickerhamomyces mucosus]|uniref:Calponin-homology (CH) domain-containing protein n=1 Tax=Wickerhamomyces mucosus TaxID=1378264 RepID=A0A9P8P7B5_9ASCO|nr:hypothetical protein WICMUC_005564 [Wickerhamomyces mucosus]